MTNKAAHDADWKAALECIKRNFGLPNFFFSEEYRRILCVSNDKRIRNFPDHNFFGPEHYIVQFNKAAHNEKLRNIETNFLYVCNKKEDGFWGISADGVPEYELPDHLGDITFLFLSLMSLSDLMGGKEIAPFKKFPYYFLNAEYLPMFRIPSGKSPSAGFSMLYLLYFINFARKSVGLKYHHIYTLGFTGSYESPQLAYSGHDFLFENKTISQWPSVCMLDFDAKPMKIVYT